MTDEPQPGDQLPEITEEMWEQIRARGSRRSTRHSFQSRYEQALQAFPDLPPWEGTDATAQALAERELKWQFRSTGGLSILKIWRDPESSLPPLSAEFFNDDFGIYDLSQRKNYPTPS